MACAAFDAYPALREWWSDPLIATLSFGIAITIYTLAERANGAHKGDNDAASAFAFLCRPPHRLLRAGTAYWIGVTIAHYAYVAVASPTIVPDGCDSFLRLVVDVIVGIWLYDAIFYAVHRAFHFGSKMHSHHARHHARSAQRLSAARVLDHSLLDGALQVGVNILVQQYSPWGGAKSRLARWAHNVIVTWLLTESHAVAGPRIGRRWFAGVRDHHRHHRTGGRPYQQFFGYLDRLDD